MAMRWSMAFDALFGRVLNPTAVFCSDRDRYYAMLPCAEGGTPAQLEQWCLYVLEGVLTELKKVDQLTQYDYLKSKILVPALTYARRRALVTAQEEAVLLASAKSGVAKAADLSAAMSGMTAAQRTYHIKKLVERKRLHPIAPNARQYTLGFDNSYLKRGVIEALGALGLEGMTGCWRAFSARTQTQADPPPTAWSAGRAGRVAGIGFRPAPGLRRGCVRGPGRR